MKLTEFFGKQIYSLYEGTTAGTISGATFNNGFNKIHSFKLFDQDETEYELPLSNIKAMADNVIITNKNKLSYYMEYKSKSPMFKTILDENAKNRGKIIDAEIDESGNILNFITDKNETLKPNALYLRKDFIYYSEKPITISKYKPKNKLVSPSNIKVHILDTNPNMSEKFAPTRLKYNPETIIGKVAKNDLYGINNEIIIKANQQITEKIIDEASKHNRLNQLYFIAI